MYEGRGASEAEDRKGLDGRHEDCCSVDLRGYDQGLA